MIVLRFLGLVVLLNVARYVVGFAAIPLVTHRMFGVMEAHPDVFNMEFTTADWVTSFSYNFVLWLAAAWGYHLMRPTLKGGEIARSFKAFGLFWLFFAALSAIYMNHYAHPRMFYMASIGDAVFAFAAVALANGLFYPSVMGRPRVS